MRWTEFYEGQNWLETKIGRENNARVDLNHPFASNGSGFLIFRKNQGRRVGGRKKENWTRKSFKQDRAVYAILYFPRNGVRGNERAYRCDAEKYCFWTHAAFQRGKIPFLPFLNKWWLAEGEGWKRRERIRWLNDEERKIRDRFSPISFSLDRNSFNSVFISPTTILIDRWYILMILRDRSKIVFLSGWSSKQTLFPYISILSLIISSER